MHFLDRHVYQVADTLIEADCTSTGTLDRSTIFPWSSVASAGWRAFVRPHQRGIDSESVGFLAYPGLLEPALAVKVRDHTDMLSMITKGP